MESPPVLRRYNNTTTSVENNRGNVTKMMIIFASFLGCFLMSIHTRYALSLVSLANEKSRSNERRIGDTGRPDTEVQNFVILFGLLMKHFMNYKSVVCFLWVVLHAPRRTWLRVFHPLIHFHGICFGSSRKPRKVWTQIIYLPLNPVVGKVTYNKNHNQS